MVMKEFPMYGTNAVTKHFNQVGTMLKVNEIFHTIQGEGPDAGTPAVFVRLSHCNLRCWFCDTEFDTGDDLTLDQILTQVDKATASDCKLVVITGGEPLLQNIIPLVLRLNHRGMSVNVETAGTVYYDGLDEIFGFKNYNTNRIICSPKTPVLNADLVKIIDAYKYVVRHGGVSDTDGLPIVSTQGKLGSMVAARSSMIARPKGSRPVFIQPMDEHDKQLNNLNTRTAVEVCLTYGYRLCLQLHKLTGLP